MIRTTSLRATVLQQINFLSHTIKLTYVRHVFREWVRSTATPSLFGGCKRCPRRDGTQRELTCTLNVAVHFENEWRGGFVRVYVQEQNECHKSIRERARGMNWFLRPSASSSGTTFGLHRSELARGASSCPYAQAHKDAHYACLVVKPAPAMVQDNEQFYEDAEAVADT